MWIIVHLSEPFLVFLAVLMYMLKLKSPGRQLSLLDPCKYFSSLHDLDFFHYILVSIWRRLMFLIDVYLVSQTWCTHSNVSLFTFQCKPFLCHASSFWSQKMSGPPNTICQESFLFCVMYYVSPCAGQSLELTSRAITEGIGTIQFICPIVNRFIFAWVDLSSWLLGCLKLRYNLLE